MEALQFHFDGKMCEIGVFSDFRHFDGKSVTDFIRINIFIQTDTFCIFVNSSDYKCCILKL